MTAPQLFFDLIGDPERLRALDEYAVLDTPPEVAFDDVALLACQLCETPVALVSLVAEDRQWFKARRGFAPYQTSLDQSVCAHALGCSDVLVIPDLALDGRTEANPLVTGSPHIRFYAGAPLVTPQSKVIGTLCVIDTQPRPEGLRPAQAAALQALARQVMSLLDFRRALQTRDQAIGDLKASEAKLRIMVETVPVGIMFAEAPSGKIVGRNGRMREIVGHGKQMAKTIDEYGGWTCFHPDGRRVAAHEFPLARVIREGRDAANLQVQYQRRDDTRVWIDINAAAIRGDDGAVTGAVVAISDIDLRKNAEAMQGLLNDELSHRMKNLLAMVQAIVVQSLRGASDVAAVRDVLDNRLVALGKSHDILLAGAAKRASIEAIVGAAVSIYDDADSSRIRCAGPPLEIGSKATLALGMMVHELVTNAAKYGALSHAEGRVAVTWSLSTDAAGERLLRIEWRESGGPPVAVPTRRGFGTRLIERGLTGQVGGAVTVLYEPSGVVCQLEAPLANFERDD